jgi:hypothetical protein
MEIQDGAQEEVLQQAADAGRGGDTIMAHMTLGEVVIPKPMMDDPEVMQTIQAIFQAYGENMGEYTVGDPANKINPETGLPEFGFFSNIFKSVKKIFKKVAPIALPILGAMIPGVGPVLGAALGGGLGGAISGGGIKGILTGAALGGAGGYLSGAAGGLSGILGKAGTMGPATASHVLSAGGTNAALSQLAAGSGLRGALGSIASKTGMGGLTSGGSSGGFGIGNLARIGGSLYGGAGDQDAIEESKNAMLRAQGKSASALQPYNQYGLGAAKQLSGNLAAGFNPGDLTGDPGYQFRQQQGESAIGKRLAAMGMGESGAAVKAAADYNQGLAATEYGSAYDRWLQQNQQLAGMGSQGQAAASDLGGIYGNIGNVQAGATMSAQEAKNKRLAEILAQLGMGR